METSSKPNGDLQPAIPGISLEPRKKPQRVHAIINPAAGQDQPVLKVLNAALQTAEVDWEMMITKAAGDARRMAQEAVNAGADLVIVHGGDGTVMECASGLIGSQVPFAIIPGGTANIMSLELGIPNEIVEACALAFNSEAVTRVIDMGQVGDHFFLLRAGVGFEAAMVEGADRELKDRLGVFAYAFSALQTLSDPPVARYHLTLDGQEEETEGLACIVANSGMMGVPGVTLPLAPGIDISDGLLDVVVVTRSDLPGIVSLIANVVSGSENRNTMLRWKVREVSISADPPQPVQVDGEILPKIPITAQVIPQAVRVIVPPVKDG